MKSYKNFQLAEFTQASNELRKHPADCRALHINIYPAMPSWDEMNILLERLQKSIKVVDGALFPQTLDRILGYVQIDAAFNPKYLEQALTASLGTYKCRVRARPSTDGIKAFEMSLLTETEVTRKRIKREEKVIMIVDDDKFLSSLIASALSPFGRVIQDGEGSNVLDLYKKESPDMVFLDIHLPSASGLDLLKNILAADPQASVVMISSDSGRDNVLSSMDLGAAWFLSKPFTKEKILEAVRQNVIFEKV